jgi:hypothetical protein
MNTTEKGDLFENRVYTILLDLLLQDKFFTPGKRSMLFQKHKYFSRDRNNEIIFDLAIEVYREGSEKPNLIVLIECKDKGRSIPVEDIETFYSKKKQVARANCKCVLFTTSELQEGAFNFAASIGMGVCRIFDDDSMAWLLERTSNISFTNTENTIAVNVFNALTNEFFVTTHNREFAMLDSKPYNNIEDFIFDIMR